MACRIRGQEQPLKFMDHTTVMTLLRSIDALLEPEDHALEVFPGLILPRLSMRIAPVGVLCICHSDIAPT
jgi:hypothetical protein